MGKSKLHVASGDGCTFKCSGCGERVDDNTVFTISSERTLLLHLCWDCRIDLTNELDAAPFDYDPRGEGMSGGWERIGRYDSCRRRALWVRFEEFAGPHPPFEDPDYILWPPLEAIELCAGREGDDAHVRVTASNPAFGNLIGCLYRASGAAQDVPYFGAAGILGSPPIGEGEGGG